MPVNKGMSLSKLPPETARCHSLVFKAIMQVVFDNRRSEIYFAMHHSPTSTPGRHITWINAAIFQVSRSNQSREISSRSIAIWETRR